MRSYYCQRTIHRKYFKSRTINNKNIYYKFSYTNGVKVVQYFFDEDSNLLVFAVFKQMHNLNEICIIMQYNIITTSVFKYLKLLSIGETSVKSIPSLHMAVFSNLFTFRKMHENHFLLNEKDDDQIAFKKWKTELTRYGVDDISVKRCFKALF